MSMPFSTATLPKTPLMSFCKTLFKNNKYPHLVSPETLADRFRTYFGLFPPLDLSTAFALCSHLGIECDYNYDLPASIRGCHIGDDYKFTIFYRPSEPDGAIRHTIFHEIWEILFHILEDQAPSNFLSPKNKEARANRFAAAILMPRKQFLEDAIRMSFDPLMLEDKYGQSASSILIRLSTVFPREESFAGLLFQNPYYQECWAEDFLLTHQSINPGCKASIIPDWLPKHHESAPVESLFFNILQQVLENQDTMKGFRLSDGFGEILFSGYPQFAQNEIVKRVIITGVSQDALPALRRSVTTSSL